MQIDYNKIGLKCGLEVHQQLDTLKLFCNCPSVLRNDSSDFTIKRKLHAVAGESGEVDVAAKYQTSLKKNFIYEGYSDTTCLVELDESPPYNINKEALKTAVQISELLNAKIFQIAQIMRKTVVDGSNTSGFQRTVLIAHDGFIQTAEGKVKIDSICLEEDSARIISQNENESIYRLDRLGIPLIEISTSPDIKTPSQAKEVALHIGKTLRSFKVKRGIGTIRQDVNVSIKKGERVEIKGVQALDLISKTVELEAARQLNIISSGKKVSSEVRKALINGETNFLRPMPGAARMYPETDLPLLKISREFINEAKKNLPKLKDELEKELEKKGLNKEMINLLLNEGKIEDFKDLLKISNNPNLVAKILLVWPKEISTRKKIPEEKISELLNLDSLEFVLQSVKEKKISESHLKHILEKIANGESPEKAILIEKHDENSTEEIVLKIIKENPGLSVNAYMGIVMKELKGKISGNEAINIIKKYVKE
ncbi:Glu-tRNA(Gln) amidotransferase subunit GatE [Candidatus Pacearchaeota archaeon]|nr:Glu-tRNA(Gln) amidotransferase subunit GatE [Candidatus Pacearchaeota archaeon]